MKIAALFALLFLAAPAHAQSANTVLSAAATSSAPGSPPVTCLLDPSCQGSWTPGAADLGVDEGVYVQFEKPLRAGFVQIKAAPEGMGQLRVYVNGSNTAATSRKMTAGESMDNQILALGGQGSAVAVKSLFLKVESSGLGKPVRLEKILFFPAGKDIQEIFAGKVAPLVLGLPGLTPAGVTASSILEPVSAYHPANLFDSKADIAWSTDGKKSDGKGESFTLTLQNPQTISGLLLWNGYQRSAEHFKANGRVLEAEVQADAQPAFTIRMADQMGAQRVAFPQTLANVRQLRLTTKNIAPGSSYKDVLLSELRLVGADGRLILPQAPLPKVTAPADFSPMLNRSYASILHQPIAGKVPEEFEFYSNLSNGCDNSRLRLRDNGTFVLYKDFNYGKADSAARPTDINANVLEGNWEPKGPNIRIFGRKYVTALQKSEYLQESTSATPRVAIFQSELGVKPYRALTAEEKQKLFAMLWAKKKGPANQNQALTWIVGATRWNGTDQYRKREVHGANYAALQQALDALLQELNPLYLSSSVLSDLLLPTDESEACWHSSSPQG